MFQIALEDVKSPALVKPDLDADLCTLILKSLARHASPPSLRIRYTCGEPPRSDTNASCSQSGDQRG